MDYLSKVKAMIVFAIIEWQSRTPGTRTDEPWSVTQTVDWIATHLYLTDVHLTKVLRDKTSMIVYTDEVIDIPGYFLKTEFNNDLVTMAHRVNKEEVKLGLRSTIEFVRWIRAAAEKNGFDNPTPNMLGK